MTVQKDPGRIRRMFAEISSRYDFLNHFLSLNLDRRWRRAAAKALAPPPGALLLDICTGTADQAIELAASIGASGGRVLGTDFTPEMLRIGKHKIERTRGARLALIAADSLRLPFRDATFDAVTVAFGIRNVCDLEGGLREMLRVLKPRGEAAILEFSPPGRGVLRRAFEVYFRRVLPRVGRFIAGSKAGGAAYTYLPESVGEFPSPAELARIIEHAGFTGVHWKRLTLGVATLHLARRGVAVESTPRIPQAVSP